jgi:hypothetical protein
LRSLGTAVLGVGRGCTLVVKEHWVGRLALVSEEVEHGHVPLVTAPLVHTGLWVLTTGFDLDGDIVSSSFFGHAGSLVTLALHVHTIVDTVEPGVVADTLGGTGLHTAVAGETSKSVAKTSADTVIFGFVDELGAETGVVATV